MSDKPPGEVPASFKGYVSECDQTDPQLASLVQNRDMTDLERFYAVTNNEGVNKDYTHAVCTFILHGGSLPEFCRINRVDLKALNEWIRADKARADQLNEALKGRREWVVEKILQELRTIGLFNAASVVEDGKVKPQSKWPKDALKAIKKVDVNEDGDISRVEFHDKIRALELAGKNLHLFNDRLEANINVSLAALVEESLNVRIE